MRLGTVILATLWLPGISAATTAVHGQGLDRSFTSDDPRLNQPISIHNRRIAVGDLLNNLSTISRVPLSAGLRNGSSDPEVLVSFDETPLIEVMRGMSSLFSYKGAEWVWSRERENGTYGYKLARPGKSRRLPDTMSVWVRGRVEKDFAFHIRMPSLDPQKRRSEAEAYVKDVYPDSPDLVDALVSVRNDSEWMQMALFTDVLSTSAQISVLNGETVRVSTEQLPPKWQQFVRQMRDAAGGNIVLNGTRVPAGNWIEFFTLFDAITGTPTIYIQLEYLGGPGLVGGVPLAKAFQKAFDPEWITDGDHDRVAQENDTIRPMMGSLASSSVQSAASADAALLMRVSRANKIPIIAMLTWVGESGQMLKEPGSNTTVKGFLGEPGVRQYIHKWNGETLLVSFRGWYHPSMRPPPYRIRLDLRTAAKRSGGTITLMDIAKTFAACGQAQLWQLSNEFPVLRDAMPLRSFLEWLGNNPAKMAEMFSDSGVGYDVVLPALRQSPLSAQLEGLSTRHPMYIIYRTQPDTGRNIIMHNFVVMSDDRKPLVGFGFAQPTVESTSSPKAAK